MSRSEMMPTTWPSANTTRLPILCSFISKAASSTVASGPMVITCEPLMSRISLTVGMMDALQSRGPHNQPERKCSAHIEHLDWRRTLTNVVQCSNRRQAFSVFWADRLERQRHAADRLAGDREAYAAALPDEGDDQAGDAEQQAKAA